MSILAVHPGAYYHIESLEAPRYASFFDHLTRPEDLPQTNLTAYDVVLIPCRTPAHRMIPNALQLRDFVEAGGTLVVTGESDCHLWLHGIAFHPQPTNYWWWLSEGADLGVKVTAPEHELFQYLDPRALTWHLHGWFEPAPGATVLATNAQGGAILIDDEESTKGRLVLTTLDPFYHHGSHFMPATTLFLDGFLKWIDRCCS